jgi:hypothetical protein
MGLQIVFIAFELSCHLLYPAVSGSDEVKSKHGEYTGWEEDIININGLP